MNKVVKILTNESTIGTFALTGVAVVSLYLGSNEIAGVAVGGIAAMMKNIQGTDGTEEKKSNDETK